MESNKSTLAAAVIAFIAGGVIAAAYTPSLEIAPVSVPGLAVYAAYLLIPTALHLKEVLQWRILRSGI